MLNPNIEMLENLISAAVSTRYKEVPPTEEEFLVINISPSYRFPFHVVSLLSVLKSMAFSSAISFPRVSLSTFFFNSHSQTVITFQPRVSNSLRL